MDNKINKKKTYSDIEKLNHNNIKEYANNKNYPNSFFLRRGIKDVDWRSATLVLKMRGYPEIEDVLDGIFETLQDMNWPEADTAVEILSSLPRNIMIENLEKATQKAKNDNDDEWLYFLGLFMEKNSIDHNEFHDLELYELLKKALD